MELWDIYDKDRALKPGVIVRGTDMKPNDYHLVVSVCVFNREHKMLIQKRQPFKTGWPGMWDITAAGSAVAGENSAMAAGRELFEEVGIGYDFSDLRPHFSINFKQGFDDFYLIEKEVDETALTLQKEEVERVMWADEETILSMIDGGTFIPYYKDLIRLIFRMGPELGAHTR